MFEQFRWYYNTVLTIVYLHFNDKNKHITDKNKYSARTIRDLVMKYDYIEEIKDNFCFQDYVYNEDRKAFPKPEWWDKVHSRLPRGAVNKFIYSLNSALTNYKRKNNKGFDMKFMTKKSPTEYLHFEDKQYPTFIRNIKSHYWFRDSKGRRKISYADIKSTKGLEIIYEKEPGKYFLHCPIERDWFPKDDRRGDNQAKFVSKGKRVISLDPGVRKFLVGYDPRGKCIFFGDKACKELTSLLYEVDEYPSNKLWKRIKNMVSELHWKCISFLMKHYDIILLPDFRVSQMIRGKKLTRITKRLLSMFSFHSFKEKLKYKCQSYGKRLIIVDESYTSCTCGRCFEINKVGSNEVYNCSYCDLEIDRDVSGARNIMIKNLSLR